MGNTGELCSKSVNALEPGPVVPFQLSRKKLTSDYSLVSSYSMKMENAGFMTSRY